MNDVSYYNKTVLEQLKKKTLLLIQTDPKIDFVYNDWVERGYCTGILFKKQIKLVRAIRRIWIKYKFPLQRIWYGEWVKCLKEYDTIILQISTLTMNVPKWIHNKYPNKRIICWYWNTVCKGTLPCKISEENVEFWSFDFADCEKYGMRRNVQYYCEPKDTVEENGKSDIYFVGHDAGRREQINAVMQYADDFGIKCDFNIINVDTFAIPYKEIQKRVMGSKAILEINRKGQTGYTLRVMESLFFEKKLITNNPSVLAAPFYRESNIFYIKDGNLEGLKEFLDVPYDKSASKYKNDYTMEAWFLNFFEV